MKALLDTHTLLWWWKDDPSLSPKARNTIARASNVIFVSAATAWEIAIKHKSGRLAAPELLDRLPSELAEEGFEALSISVDHALRAGLLIERHKDPFHRMLIAQAQAENLSVISNDAVFGQVRRAPDLVANGSTRLHSLQVGAKVPPQYSAQEEQMDTLRSIAGLMYAVGWLSGILSGIYRILVYSGKLEVVGHILPYNLLQLCGVAFLIAIASDARVIASTRERL